MPAHDPNPDNLDALTADQAARSWHVLERLHDLPGIGSEWPPTLATLLAAVALQNVELEILEHHNAWLRRTRRAVQRRGWPWTTANMNRDLNLRLVGE